MWNLVGNSSSALLKEEAFVVVDVKSVLNVSEKPKKIDLWRL